MLPGSTGRFYKDDVVHNHCAHRYYITRIERDMHELNPNDAITQTRGVVYPARVCIPTVEVDPFDPASCKPIFVAPLPPRLSSLPTQQQHDDVSSTSGHSTSPTLPTAKSALLSAAIGYHYYPPRSCLSPNISHGRLSQISLCHHVLHAADGQL